MYKLFIIVVRHDVFCVRGKLAEPRASGLLILTHIDSMGPLNVLCLGGHLWPMIRVSDSMRCHRCALAPIPFCRCSGIGRFLYPLLRTVGAAL